MYDRTERDQPGLEFDVTKETAHAIYPVYPVTDNKLEYVGDCSDIPQPSSEQKPRHNPFGLRPLWFGILIATITTIIVGVAIGAGIGGAMARSSPKPSSSLQGGSSLSVPVAATATTSSSASPVSVTVVATATATQTGEYAPLAPSDVKLLQHPCPSENYTYQVNGDPFPPQLFKWECQTAWLGNNRGTTGITLMQLSAYTAEQCVEACGGMNVWRNEQICSAVTFQASMSSEYAVGRGNCWLFSGTQSTWDDPGALTCISATL